MEIFVLLWEIYPGFDGGYFFPPSSYFLGSFINHFWHYDSSHHFNALGLYHGVPHVTFSTWHWMTPSLMAPRISYSPKEADLVSPQHLSSFCLTSLPLDYCKQKVISPQKLHLAKYRTGRTAWLPANNSLGNHPGSVIPWALILFHVHQQSAHL